MRDREHFEAVRLMTWWALFANHKGLDQRLLMAIPNGGHRHIAVAMKMKAEGVRAGAPDYILCVPKNGAGALWIELKTEDGKTSKAQNEMIELLSSNGYACTVAFGWDEARKKIEEWVG